MNELFPIIRRKRRPLIVEDAPPVVVGNVEPPKVEAGDVQQNRTDATDGTHDKERSDDAHVTNQRESR